MPERTVDLTNGYVIPERVRDGEGVLTVRNSTVRISGFFYITGNTQQTIDITGIAQNHTVLVSNNFGSRRSRVLLPTTPITNTIDPSMESYFGEIYILHYYSTISQNAYISVHSADGTYRRRITLSGTAGLALLGLAIHNGEIYLSINGRSNLRVHTIGGAYSRDLTLSWPGQGTSPPTYFFLAIDNNLIYTFNVFGTVSVFSLTGEWRRYIIYEITTPDSLSGSLSIRGATVNGGTIYVLTESPQGNTYILRVNANSPYNQIGSPLRLDAPPFYTLAVLNGSFYTIDFNTPASTNIRDEYLDIFRPINDSTRIARLTYKRETVNAWLNGRRVDEMHLNGRLVDSLAGQSI